MGAGSSALRCEEFGGYKSIAPADSDSVWYSMLLPGRSGYGLQVACIAAASCCNGYYGNYSATVLWRTKEELWQHPVLVEWVSIIDPQTNRVYEDILDMLDDSVLAGPLVGIRSHHGLSEFRWLWESLITEEECERGDPSESFETSVGPLIGFLPVWEIVPFNSNYAADAQNEIDQIPTAIWGAELLDQCYCSLDYYSEHETAMPDGSFTTSPVEDNCVYTFGSQKCSCGKDPSMLQVWEALMNECPDFGANLLPPVDQIWRYGVNQMKEGWLAFFMHTRDIDNDATTDKEIVSCYTSFLQRRCPYSPSYGPDGQITRRLLNSTSSEMQRAS